MAREKYTEKLMKLLEIRDEWGLPVADTRAEVSDLLKEFYLEQLADHAEQGGRNAMALEDNIRAIEHGRSL